MEKIIKSDRKKTFEIFTNFTNIQKQIPHFFPSINTKSSRDNVTILEEHMILDKKELIIMAKHVIDYPNSHEIFFIGGDCKGSHLIQRFEPIDKGTKLTVEGAFKAKRLFGLKDDSEKYFEEYCKIIDELAKIAEV